MQKKIGILLAVLFLAMTAPAGLFAASFDPLLPLLVDLPGWKADAAEGIDMAQAGMSGITVFREYTSGGKGLTATILVGAQAGLTWTAAYKEGFKQDTTEGSGEVRKVNGFLVYLVYDKTDASTGLIVLLLQPVADKAGSGALFALDLGTMPLDEGLKLAQKFDWTKMKDAAGKVK
jgi:hypothetical protein